MRRTLIALGMATMTVLFSGSGELCLAADSVATVVEWNSQQSEAARDCVSSLVQWPSSKELASPIPADDSLAARGCCREWLALVIQPKWVPSDVVSRLTAIHRSPEGHDLLVAEYAVDDCKFRIWDTSVSITIEISSPAVAQDVADWAAFAKAVTGKFLNGTGGHDGKVGVDEFNRCRVHHGGDVARILLDYAVPAVKEDNPKRYWHEGSPEYWKQGGKLVIKVSKLPDGEHPLHREYGLKQRFPSVESALVSATPEQLIERLLAVSPADPDTMAWGSLAQRAMRDRPDRLGIVIPLLRSMNRAKGEQAQLMVINAVDDLLQNCKDRSLLGATKEQLLTFSADLKDRRVRGQTANVLKHIDDLLQPTASGRDEPGKSRGKSDGMPTTLP